MYTPSCTFPAYGLSTLPCTDRVVKKKGKPTFGGHFEIFPGGN